MRKISLILVLFVLSVFAFTSLALAQITTTDGENLPLRDTRTAEKLKGEEKKIADQKAEAEKKSPPVTMPRIPWETIAVVVSIFSGVCAILGFSFSGHRKKRAISKYMGEIDTTFEEFKMKSKRCEAELYRLHDVLEDELKKGKIDESLFDLLSKRIDKYIAEVQKA